MPSVRRVMLILLVALLCAGAGAAHAAELIMFEDPACVWCKRWHAEIGPSYPRSEEGRKAPLRRVHVRDQSRAGARLDRPITATPTFVLVDGGREIGRITGYSGADYFYPMLGEILRRVPDSPEPYPKPSFRDARAAAN
jgi:hypothetical protein